MRKNPHREAHQQKNLDDLDDQRHTVKPDGVLRVDIKEKRNVEKPKDKSNEDFVPFLQFIDEISVQYHRYDVCVNNHPEHVRVCPPGNFFIKRRKKFIVPG